MTTHHKGSKYLSAGAKRTALSIALGICFAGGVHAQSTTGSIRGTVPAGTTVVITNNSGLTRTITADAQGRYNASSLPVGSYTVEAQGVGKQNVTVIVGAAVDASFGGQLDTITVTGASVAPIDVTTVSTSTVITAEQLQRLPIARSAEAIALLAPGATAGAGGYFGNMVSFGGAGVSENAYYINGYFSGEPLSNLGGFDLPYGAIEQQETYTGGYSAKYGRSAGGVISQIGKSGSNDWQFGGQVIFTPKSLREDAEDLFYPNMDFSQANSNPNLPSTCGEDGNERCAWGYENPGLPGTMYSTGKDAEDENLTYSAYVGGPIIKDKLFFFLAGEGNKTETRSARPVAVGASSRYTHSEVTDPKLYAKIDWSITDNHMVDFTYMKEKYEDSGYYTDLNTGARITDTGPTLVEQDSEYNILKYTGYLTDSLTLSAVYGKSEFTHYRAPFLIPGLPFISGAANQNVAVTPGGAVIPNRQGGYQGKDALDETDGLRVDLEWVVGDHALTFGIDNIKFEATNEGDAQLADVWIYGIADGAINPGLNVGSPVSAANPDGYYVQAYKYFTTTSMSLEQKAWYIEDRWQVTDNLLLSLGVRNDQFTNKNDRGEIYMDAKDQWAPRLGFSWDVLGDSTFKVFGNAGRYFLAMPNNVAIRGASASTFTREYFTYTGIDADGRPTGLTNVPMTDGSQPRPVSANGEYGDRVDVLSFAPKDLKNMYQDEFILGIENQFSENFKMGAKLTYRDLKSSVDDVCDPYTLIDKIGGTPDSAYKAGYNVELEDGRHAYVNYCYMFNPGGTNTFSIGLLDGPGADANETGERMEVTMSSDDWRFQDGLKRKYQALDVFFERPWDGKWEARLDYTFSRLRGNNEGQVKSEFGQSNISKTQDWDVAEMMRYANGYLANDRTHTFKLRGSYAILEDLVVSANYLVQSGMPVSCLGLWNPDGSIDENTGDADPIGYGSSYHTCFGEIATPGKIRAPWTRKLDLALNYRPNFWDKKVGFGLQVFNVLDDQKPVQYDVTSGTDAAYTVSNTYMLPIARQTPRYVKFSVSYDW
jgi:outer membrane receptor protein involved in Fe transport